jgi:polysaccharide export outer membrane protein
MASFLRPRRRLSRAWLLAASLHIDRLQVNLMVKIRVWAVCVGALFTTLHGLALAQTPSATPRVGTASHAPAGVTTPPDYVIGADDQLAIRFWGDEKLSVDVSVRPDGKISVPLLNDVQAAGLTPEELNKVLETAASRYIADPDATVIVREIRSRKVYVLGQVSKPGPIQLNTDMTVLQALAEAGGLLEYAHKDDLVIVRKAGGKEQRFKFNYGDVFDGKKLQQNILLQPGDTILIK